MRYLIDTTEVYRVETEKEATQLIEAAKKDSTSDLIKYSSTRKERKQRGEIIDEYFKVTLVRHFTDEKEPIEQFQVNYSTQLYNNGDEE